MSNYNAFPYCFELALVVTAKRMSPMNSGKNQGLLHHLHAVMARSNATKPSRAADSTSPYGSPRAPWALAMTCGMWVPSV